jgi:hypothetical protein
MAEFDTTGFVDISGGECVAWILGLWGRCRWVLFELHIDVISVFLLRV